MNLNPIAQTADAALIRAQANAAGEIPGTGKPWACESFGKYGHNAAACIKCTTNFMTDKGAGK